MEVGNMEILNLLSLFADLYGIVKDFPEFLTSDSHFKLGIVIVGLVTQKKEEPPSLPTR
jgi:hypothetical protein